MTSGANARDVACVRISDDSFASLEFFIDTLDRSHSPAPARAPGFPPAPWHLHGWGCASVHLADVSAVRHLVPRGMRIAQIFPGKTLSALYFASYKGASSLVYRELAIAVAVVRHAGALYAWAPHLYVDDPLSVAGGREIWGVRKSLASFERTHTHDRTLVSVRVDGREVATIGATAIGPSVPVRTSLPTLGMRDEIALPFAADARARVRLASARIGLPSDSPFRPAFRRGALVALLFDELALVVPEPA